MRARLSGQLGAGPQHAITDLYDEERRTFSVRYPAWFIVTLSLTGVVAFGMTGFLGYTSDSPFRLPWELFLWFCALLVTLQVSIFRDASLRRRLIATLILTGLCILAVVLTKYATLLPDVLRRLLGGGLIRRWLETEPYSYNIINFGLLAIFWIDTLRRWIRRARGLPPNPRVRLGIASDSTVSERPDDLPSLQELVSGDLIAGAVLAIALAGVFQPDFVRLFVHPEQLPATAGATLKPISDCTVSWFAGACGVNGVGGAGRLDPPTLSFLDVIQTLIYLPLGLVVLAIAATLGGLVAVNAVGSRNLAAPDVPATADNAEGAAEPIVEDVATVIINALRAALDRRLRQLATTLALAFRLIGWPALLFLATYGAAEVADNVQKYLHGSKSLDHAVIYVLPALAWGVLAILGLVISSALLIFRWRVVENSLRFIGLVAFVVLLTFWLFSLALWGFNQLLLITNALASYAEANRHPFDPPSWTTGASFAALLLFGALLLFRSRRPSAALTGAATPVAASDGGASRRDGSAPQTIQRGPEQ